MSSIRLSHFVGQWLPQVEAEMHSVLGSGDPALIAHYGMQRYHLGWANETFASEPSPAGKRIRPMLCLLACAEVGGETSTAIPAAAAIELLHNFSLIHDDIEDGDETRRHRPTLWKLWGVPQAINAGDAMFSLAFAAIQRLDERGLHAETTLAALRLFTQTCIELTEGQHLDMAFEQRSDVTVDEYLRMIRGKTAALVGASAAIGALVGGAEAMQSEALWRFGINLGLAFQIQDDILGIWGNPAATGKAAGNDILRRKKSLPMLHALAHAGVGPRLAALLADPGFGGDRIDEALALFDEAGTRAHAVALMESFHTRALAALDEGLGLRTTRSALHELTESLLHREY